MAPNVPDEMTRDLCNNNIEVSTSDESPITEFFYGKTVFITGGTGFMGKVTIEKLLRVTNVKKILMLIRPKKNKDIEKRLNDLFADPLFDKLRTKYGNSFIDRIEPINGDCSVPKLGLTYEDKMKIIQEANIVIHGAATVRFNETSKVAININVQGTKNLLLLCKEIENLIAVSYVSTAFAHCQHSHVEEKIYDHPMSAEKMIYLSNNLSTEMLQKIESDMLCESPNVYTFSKSLAENIVKETSEGLPISIFRPPVLLPTRSEPLSGWSDNLYGPSSLLLGVATGILRVIYVNKKLDTNLAPVDMAVNTLLATIWDTAQSSPKPLTVYNYVPNAENMPNFELYEKCIYKHGLQMPLLNMLWYPTVTMTSNKFLYNILFFLYHTLPGIFFDIVLALIGHKIRLNKIYDKIKTSCEYLDYFAEHSWTFSSTNTMKLWQKMTPCDKELYDFDLSSINWADLFKNSLIGMRIFLGKETPETIPQARRKLLWLKISHYTVLALIYSSVFICFYKIFTFC